MYVTERQKGNNSSREPIPQGLYVAEWHKGNKSFGFRLRYQCREVFSLEPTFRIVSLEQEDLEGRD